MIFELFILLCLPYTSKLKLNGLESDIKYSTRDKIYAVSIEGLLYCITLYNGNILWRKYDMRVVSIVAGLEPELDFRRYLIPNPTDGSLYSLSGNKKSPFFLKKLPSNIQELVSRSPFRSTNDIYQIGYKHDVWEEICPITGNKVSHITPFQQNISSDHQAGQDLLILSKTQYNLALFSTSNRQNIINITYFHYNFEKNPSNDYEYIFLTSPLGIFVAIHVPSSTVIWKLQLDSVIVHAFYSFQKRTVKFPLFHVSKEFVDSLNIGDYFNINEIPFMSISPFVSKCNTYSYALMYLKEADTSVIVRERDHVNNNPSIALYDTENDQLGSYRIFSEYIKTFMVSHTEKDVTISNSAVSSKSETREVKIVPILFTFGLTILTILTILFLAIFKKKDMEYEELLKKFVPIDNDDLRLGKIKYDPNSLLGQGCDGTLVYTGTFEGRPVAVKRILLTSTEIANQEIQTLKDSDQHPNVIRYFATEKDSQFYYIALELCQYTLAEFVRDRDFEKYGLDSIAALLQAARGLKHLHELRIIHRDIKPQNILIGQPNHLGISRVLISDFGLCKKVPMDKSNVTNNMSAVAGTYGWIAPEAFDDTQRLSFSSDIFSLGCVFYFVCSGGLHPFGDELNRQYNIQNNKFELDKFLKDINKYEAASLISQMLESSPDKRIICQDILTHIFFWEPNKRIQFLQDFSNIVEDFSNSHPHIIELEKNSIEIIRGSWSFHIPPRLLENLCAYRCYSPTSVRDLIRAIRNKANHFNDTPDDVKSYFKENPNNLVVYFSKQFPRFLVHIYQTAKRLDYDSMDAFKHYFTNVQ